MSSWIVSEKTDLHSCCTNHEEVSSPTHNILLEHSSSCSTIILVYMLSWSEIAWNSWWKNISMERTTYYSTCWPHFWSIEKCIGQIDNSRYSLVCKWWKCNFNFANFNRLNTCIDTENLVIVFTNSFSVTLRRLVIQIKTVQVCFALQIKRRFTFIFLKTFDFVNYIWYASHWTYERSKHSQFKCEGFEVLVSLAIYPHREMSEIMCSI